MDPGRIAEEAQEKVALHNQEGSDRRRHGANRDEQRVQCRWRLPEGGTLKINCDASSSMERGCGIGIIARDDCGALRWAASRSIQQGSEPLIAELEAVIWALESARDR